MVLDRLSHGADPTCRAAYRALGRHLGSRGALWARCGRTLPWPVADTLRAVATSRGAVSIEAGELPRPLSLTRMETIVNTLIDHDLADLDLDLAAWARPEALTADARDLQEGEWAVFGAVAAVLGIAVSVVAYICGVCGARSFWACMSAVRNYWGAGC